MADLPAELRAIADETISFQGYDSREGIATPHNLATALLDVAEDMHERLIDVALLVNRRRCKSRRSFKQALAPLAAGERASIVMGLADSEARRPMNVVVVSNRGILSSEIMVSIMLNGLADREWVQRVGSLLVRSAGLPQAICDQGADAIDDRRSNTGSITFAREGYRSALYKSGWLMLLDRGLADEASHLLDRFDVPYERDQEGAHHDRIQFGPEPLALGQELRRTIRRALEPMLRRFDRFGRYLTPQERSAFRANLDRQG